MDIPVYMPGNNRNWNEVRGRMHILPGGLLTVILDEEDSELLAKMMADGTLLQVGFDYRMPEAERNRLINGTQAYEDCDENCKDDDGEKSETYGPTQIDAKYGKVYTERGNFEHGEPVFVLRARDAYAVDTIKHYAKLCDEGASPLRHAQAVNKVAKTFVNWQRENHIKYPD